ncbi:MAG: GNAT family N-acetyltransferase [bacterium]
MSQIKRVPARDVDQFIDIMCDAYPGMSIHTPKEKEQIRPRIDARLADPRTSLYAMYDGGRMRGGLLLYDYTMNLFGQRVPAGGAGSLAVHLAHKKQHVAKGLCRFFLGHYRRQGSPIAVLWPFRPDFYRKMGAGLGSKGHLYEIDPAGIPRGKSCRHVRYLTEKDLPSLNDCYNRWVARTNGAIEETLAWRQVRFRFGQKERWLVYAKGGRILGYLRIDFKKGKRDDFLDHNFLVKELIYENADVLGELLTFLSTQFDQVSRIELITTDDDFHFALDDARKSGPAVFPSVYHPSHLSGLGIMYRVLNVEGLFAAMVGRDFNGQTIRLGLHVRDTFLRANHGRRVVYFRRGKARPTAPDQPTDVEMQIDVADFSSLIIGAVRLRSLFDYGLVKLSDETLSAELDHLFRTDTKPACLTEF